MIDGPFLKIRELDALRDYAMRTRILGYDGKWALHPDQVAVINEVFTPTQEQFDHAFDILEAYEKATTEGDRRGAVMFGDEMIDEASRKMALKFVSRGERAGMSPQRDRSLTRASDARGSRSWATKSRSSDVVRGPNDWLAVGIVRRIVSRSSRLNSHGTRARDRRRAGGAR